MISIFIPTLNAESSLHGLLTQLKKQPVPCEIVVVDSSSSDNTIKIAQSVGVRTVIIKRNNFDHGGTRNLALTHAKGDIFVFLTQDALPEDIHFLENLIKPLEQHDIAAAYGRQVPKADAMPTERFARLFNYPDTPLVKGKGDISSLGIRAFFFSNVCSAIRRKEFEELGGFTEGVIMNEDMLMAGRLILSGYRIAYVPDARIIHSHDYSWIHQFKRYFDIGVFLKKDLQPLTYVKADNTGARFLKDELGYLVKNREYRWLPYVFVEAISKYLGYKLGLHFTLIPNPLRKIMSMHRHYWSTRQNP
jgi:rhamnosyltransferase